MSCTYLANCRRVAGKTVIVFERYDIRMERTQTDGEIRETDLKRYFVDVSEHDVILDNRELQHFALRIRMF